VRPILESILTRIFEQQKYAEAKNAALAAAAGAAGAAMVTAYSIRSAPGAPGWTPLLLVAGIILFVAMLVALSALFPITSNKVSASIQQPNKPNLYYFEDLKTMNEQSLLVHLHESLGKDAMPGSPNPTQLEAQLANQIIVSSQIASGKFSTFRRAGYIFAFGAVVVVAILALEAISPRSTSAVISKSAPLTK
jgi:Family of unknown function (DUF5706)